MKSLMITALIAAGIGMGAAHLLAADAAYQRNGGLYNVKTEQMINGRIMKVDSIAPAGSMPGEVYLMVKTTAETTTVLVGPGWYLSDQNFLVNGGDSARIIGSRVRFEGRTVIIAREIKVGNGRLQLRGANGLPLWAEMGGRR
jgi:hypothetical protein